MFPSEKAMPNANIGLPLPPDILRGVPKSVIRALKASEALRGTLGVTKNRSFGPFLAFDVVESYFEAAKRQQRRIEKAKARLKKGAPTRTRSLFEEVHFYLICWARIAKLTRYIASTTKFRRTGLVLRRYHAELTERVVGRDHLEHFEERLPGAPKNNKLANPSDLLNMDGHFLTYGGQKIDVGPASALLLRDIVAEFRTALIFDSIEALAAADPKEVYYLLRHVASQRHVVRVAKRFDKLFGPRTAGGTKGSVKQPASPGANEPGPAR
jgi:hypothetical protein